MPVLSADTLLTLAGYPQSRNGEDMGHTMSGLVWEYACWNWTLSGGRLHASSPTSAPSIVDDLIQMDWQDVRHIWGSTMNPAPVGNYAGSGGDLATMAGTFPAARTVRPHIPPRSLIPHPPFTGAQATFALALLRVMLRANGLVPTAAPVATAPYTVTMKSSDWWNSDHFAIGILLPPNGTRSYIQTVPETPVSHSCNVVWDESLPDVATAIAGLLQVHVDVINQVPRAPCRICHTAHGWTWSVVRSWHQCTTCGAIYCPTHGAALGGKVGWSGTRSCSRPGCAGRTRLW